MKGIVKWFSSSKGFGFINEILDDEIVPKDIFVHASEVDGGVLIDGQHVEFEVCIGPRGPKAKNVVVKPLEDNLS